MVFEFGRGKDTTSVSFLDEGGPDA
jgi:hypothetical protein